MKALFYGSVFITLYSSCLELKVFPTVGLTASSSRLDTVLCFCRRKLYIHAVFAKESFLPNNRYKERENFTDEDQQGTGAVRQQRPVNQSVRMSVDQTLVESLERVG